jgi:hypothetical protein
MALLSPKDCRLIRRLHSKLGSTSAHEAEAARQKIIDLLATTPTVSARK